MLFNSDETIIKRFFKKEEKHHGYAISFYELINLCKERYMLIENELFDLKKILNHHFNIENIVFKNTLDGELALVIEYYDNKKEYLVLTMDSFDEINMVLDTSGGKYNKLIDYIKPVIKEAFIKEDIMSISKSFSIQSSSKNFNINGVSNELTLIFNSKNFNNFFHLNYLFNTNNVNDQELLKYFDCKTTFEEVKMNLEDLNNLKKFLMNIKIKEENIPKVLIKNKR